MQVQFVTVALGLAAAIVWGGGDFCGGQATRRASVFSVLIAAEISGLLMLIVLALAWGEALPAMTTIRWGLAAGFMGAIGLAALYQALSIGQAGMVAPVSAVIAAAIPALYSALTEGPPDALHLAGFGLALVAVWLVAQSNQSKQGVQGLGLALLAGCGFGSFFILIHYASITTTFWPLAIARATAVPLVWVTALYRRSTWTPTRAVLPLALLCGLLDAGGNALFVLAAQTGRLDVAAILSSLYPASTVILAWLILGERTSWVQRIGIVTALGAIVLIAS
jgi:drug/metabolite transporter (DMT)-like permease